jgi:hypothetical protein
VLDPAEPAPELTAHSEAALAAVYRHVADMTGAEAETADDPGAEDPTYWRRRARAAYREVEERGRGGSGWRPPGVNSRDAEGWEFLVLELLAEEFFWDADHEIGPLFLDADPDQSRYLMGRMGVAEDYFRAVAPDPPAAELEGVRRALRRACRGRGRRGRR